MNGKIISLNAENFKRLSAVHIEPNGNVVVIGGDNAQGKTSVLDAIQAALGGETNTTMPVRKGADKSKIVIKLSGVDLEVERRFTAAGGSTLIVRNTDGIKQLSPQTILDKLYGALSFDPLDFARQKPKDQAEILRGIVGIDFTKDDERRQAAFDERTVVSRDARALEARMAGMPKHDNVADGEVSSADIIERQQKAIEHNGANDRKRSDLTNAKNVVSNYEATINGKKEAIKELQEKLEEAQKELGTLQTELTRRQLAITTQEGEVAKLKDIDVEPFKTQLANIETENRKVRETAARNVVVGEYRQKTDRAQELSEEIDGIDTKKRKATMEAKFPIAGLGLDLTGAVTFNDIPLEQASEAEKLKVSVAIGLALNPTLKVLLIRDGSLLDNKSMAALAEMANAADAQIWVERVGKADETAVIIEDGHVADSPLGADKTRTKVFDKNKPEPTKAGELL